MSVATDGGRALDEGGDSSATSTAPARVATTPQACLLELENGLRDGSGETIVSGDEGVAEAARPLAAIDEARSAHAWGGRVESLVALDRI